MAPKQRSCTLCDWVGPNGSYCNHRRKHHPDAPVRAYEKGKTPEEKAESNRAKTAKCRANKSHHAKVRALVPPHSMLSAL